MEAYDGKCDSDDDYADTPDAYEFPYCEIKFSKTKAYNKFMTYFGCAIDPTGSDQYLCKVYQPSVEYAHDGFPRFGGGEVAWAYHLHPDNTFAA